VLLLVGACAWFLGALRLRALTFPLGFLVFLAPMPEFVARWVESLLQLGSAGAAFAFFRSVGTPVYYHDLIFQLPGFSLQIAPECSGIHSSVVLFITSLLAGYLFLRTPWKRTFLALAVIPLALLRNGFRVFTIGELCVHVGPQMIDSPIHHKGGPLFFALSLVPFFALLLFLVKSDRREGSGKSQTLGA
jgi:exosortase C (VPDSG-CTERM-specific)